MGKDRTRAPVAWKSAFATAGAIGGTPGSPTPVGGAEESTMWTSTTGISLIRNGWYWWKFDCSTVPPLPSVMAPCSAAERPQHPKDRGRAVDVDGLRAPVD